MGVGAAEVRPGEPADTTLAPAEALALMRELPDAIWPMEDPTIRFLELELDGTWRPSWAFVTEVGPAPQFGPWGYSPVPWQAE